MTHTPTQTSPLPLDQGVPHLRSFIHKSPLEVIEPHCDCGVEASENRRAHPPPLPQPCTPLLLLITSLPPHQTSLQPHRLSLFPHQSSLHLLSPRPLPRDWRPESWGRPPPAVQGGFQCVHSTLHALACKVCNVH